MPCNFVVIVDSEKYIFRNHSEKSKSGKGFRDLLTFFLHKTVSLLVFSEINSEKTFRLISETCLLRCFMISSSDKKLWRYGKLPESWITMILHWILVKVFTMFYSVVYRT